MDDRNDTMPEKGEVEKIDTKKLSESLKALVKALEEGKYNAAPSELTQGCDCFKVDDEPR